MKAKAVFREIGEAMRLAGDHTVRVFGTLKYKRRNKFPHAVQATSLEVADADPRLSLLGLKGLAPDATGDKSTEDFVAMIRDDWEA